MRFLLVTFFQPKSQILVSFLVEPLRLSDSVLGYLISNKLTQLMHF